MNAFIERLLKDVEAINEKLLEQTRRRNSFNVFEIEGIDRKEVPMCRFLCAVLNPDGGHGKGEEILISFARRILGINLPGGGAYTVKREEQIDNNRRIDIVIKGNGFWIPIEAKIYAQDGIRQCNDYLQYAKTQVPDAKLFYLTPTRKAPSVYSSWGEHNEIECISWGEIAAWLKSFYEQELNACEDADLIVCLKQYCAAIGNFIRNNEIEINMKELLCKDEKSFKAAATVYQNYNYVKTQILKEFFDVLDAKLSEKIKILDSVDGKKLLGDKIFDTETEDKISSFYDYKKSTHPAITYPFTKTGALLSKVLNGEYVLAIRIEVGENLYIGLCFPHIAKTANGYEYECRLKMPEGWRAVEIKSHYGKSLFKSETVKENDWWLAWSYIGFTENGNPVNFKYDGVDNDAYFKLCKRENIEKLAEICCNKFAAVFDFVKDGMLN